jgi:general secretion pathway protein I
MIEVLLALVIFALMAVVMGASYVNVLNGYESARLANANDSDLAFARGQLLVQADLQAAQAGAEFDDGERHVKWTAQADPANVTDLFTVTLTCVMTDTRTSDPRTVVETFMLVRPTWSDPAARAQLRSDAATRVAQVQGRVAK